MTITFTIFARAYWGFCGGIARLYHLYQNSELHLYVIRNGIFYSEFQKNGINGIFSTITSKNDDFLRILRRFGGQNYTKRLVYLWSIGIFSEPKVCQNGTLGTLRRGTLGTPPPCFWYIFKIIPMKYTKIWHLLV